MWGTAVWNSRSMASVLHVHCQKGRFKSNCIALLYSSVSFWALQGAEDKVPLCDQNVAAHPQHSTHDLDSISAQSRTLQPHYNLATHYSLVRGSRGQDRAQIHFPTPLLQTGVITHSLRRSLVMDGDAENGAPSPSFCRQIHPWPHYLPG